MSLPLFSIVLEGNRITVTPWLEILNETQKLLGAPGIATSSVIYIDSGDGHILTSYQKRETFPSSLEVKAI